MKRHVRGFTIVELSIVILVIGILATVVVVGYRGSQDRAHDLQIRDAATQVADQIQLFASNAGHFPRGGYGSTTAIGAGTECIDGASGWFGSSIYTCTVENTLVASGYLPSGFSVRLPQMPGYSAGTSSRAIMVYVANATTRLAMVYYYLASPTAADTENFNDELTECGYNPAGVIGPRDSYGMRNGICLKY